MHYPIEETTDAHENQTENEEDHQAAACPPHDDLVHLHQCATLTTTVDTTIEIEIAITWTEIETVMAGCVIIGERGVREVGVEVR